MLIDSLKVPFMKEHSLPDKLREYDVLVVNDLNSSECNTERLMVPD